MMKGHFLQLFLVGLSICFGLSNISANAYEYHDASYENTWNIKQSQNTYKSRGSSGNDSVITVGKQSTKKQQTAREFIEENAKRKAVDAKQKEKLKMKLKKVEEKAKENRPETEMKKDKSLQITAAYGLMTHKMGEYVINEGEKIS